MKNKKLLLISLNELNFELIEKYIDKYNLKNLNYIKNNISTTNSEKEYKLLEPWIQWFSAYNGLEAKNHGVTRLGDGASSKFNSVFKDLNDNGIKVGAISPMNISNDLKSSDFFIPDPWIITKSSDDLWHKLIHQSISELVKDNARKKNKFKNYFIFFIVFLKFSTLKRYPTYFQLFFKSLKKKWYKSLFLDYFLHDLHLKFIRKYKTDFSNIFFNSIAHIQHHYLFNSIMSDEKKKNPDWYLSNKEDPFKDSLIIFDKILGDYIKMESNYSIIVATGLRQIFYDSKKFYYRLKNHESFFSNFGIKFNNIQELMSRDFIITFNNHEDCQKSYKIISKIVTEKEKNIFGDFDINKNKLFLTLIYNEEIIDQKINANNKTISLKNYVDFVAIKNGMHDGKGYIYSSKIKSPPNLEVHKIKDMIISYYAN